MVKHADLLICDSKNIEAYIQKDYAKYRHRRPILLMEPIQASLS